MLDTETKLTADNVNKCFIGCLFEDGTDRSVMEQTAIRATGITMSIGFDPDKIAKSRDQIIGFLQELPAEFMAHGGGGMSFLQMCTDRSGRQWGEHRNMEQLVLLGLAIGAVEYCLPRELWGILPGGVPYIAVVCWPRCE